MRGTVIDLLTHVQCLISIYNYRDNCDNKVYYRNNKNFIIAQCLLCYDRALTHTEIFTCHVTVTNLQHAGIKRVIL